MASETDPFRGTFEVLGIPTHVKSLLPEEGRSQVLYCCEGN